MRRDTRVGQHSPARGHSPQKGADIAASSPVSPYPAAVAPSSGASPPSLGGFTIANVHSGKGRTFAIMRSVTGAGRLSAPTRKSMLSAFPPSAASSASSVRRQIPRCFGHFVDRKFVRCFHPMKPRSYIRGQPPARRTARSAYDRSSRVRFRPVIIARRRKRHSTSITIRIRSFRSTDPVWHVRFPEGTST